MKSVMLLVIVTLYCAVLPAQAGSKDADAAWQKLEAIAGDRPPSGLDSDSMMEWAGQQALSLAENTVSFVDDYPADARSFTAISNLTLRMQLLDFKDRERLGLDSLIEKTLSQSEIPDKEKQSMMTYYIYVILSDSLKQEGKLQTDTLKLARQKIDEFTRLFPESGNKALLEHRYGNALLEIDPDAIPAQVESLKKSADSRVVDTGKALFERYQITKTPLDMAFTAIDGREVDLAKMRGKVVLIDFWGTWCMPCRKEIPHIRAVYEKYHDQGFEVIGIACEHSESDETLKEFIEEEEIPWPQYFDAGFRAKKLGLTSYEMRFGINAFPAIWLLNKEGKVVQRNLRGEADLEAAVRRELGLNKKAAVEPAKPSITLKVGDQAPSLDSAIWLKGDPVAMGKGKPTVVEFWATWCGPCQAGMPHLSEIAEKFSGRANVVGISVWENIHSDDDDEDPMPRVKNFVKYANEMMNYTVAADAPDNHLADTWLKAAGKQGIPAAFIVDQQGEIVWSGYPGHGMEEVLELVIDGKYDESAREARAKQREKDLAVASDVNSQMKVAEEANDKQKMLNLNLELQKLFPGNTRIDLKIYDLLTQVNPELAGQYGELMLKKYYRSPMVLVSLANKILQGESSDYLLAVKLLEQAQKYYEPSRAAALGTMAKTALSKASGKKEKSNDVEFKVGDKAPPFKAGKWYRGEPIQKYEEGKVYVIELWATWCYYCITAMPHLDELSQELKGKAEFVSINVMESRGLKPEEARIYEDEKIREFLTEGEGESLTYGVAIDTEGKYFEKTWMPISGQVGGPTNAIPMVFIVDQKGRLAWVGNPHVGMDEALREILAGTYNVNQFVSDSSARQAEISIQNYISQLNRESRILRAQNVVESIEKDLSKEDYAGFLYRLYKEIDQDKDLRVYTLKDRMEAYKNLLHKDELKALELVEWEKLNAEPFTIDKDSQRVGNRDRNYVSVLSVFASADNASSSVYKFAISEMEPMRFDLPVFEGQSIQALCNAYYRVKDFEKGINLTQSVSKGLKSNGLDYSEWVEISEKFQRAIDGNKGAKR